MLTRNAMLIILGRGAQNFQKFLIKLGPPPRGSNFITTIDFKIEIDFKKISIMTDFERGIRKALKEVFDGKPLYDCYFHFIKNLWEKEKQFGLFKRDLRKTTSIIIFSMKMYPYLIRELITSVNGFVKN